MTNELVQTEETPTESTMLQVIERAASNPDVDVEKMTALLDLQERIMDKQAVIDFTASMNSLQSEMPIITQDGQVSYENKEKKIMEKAYGFATLPNILRTIRPSLEKHDFVLSFTTSDREGGGCEAVAKIKHKGGHFEESRFSGALDTSGGKNNIQAMGSSRSYGKRYCVIDLLNIIVEGEDDDGQTSEPITEAQVDHLQMLLNETGIGADKICNFAGADSIPGIQQGKFDSVVKRLMERKKQKEKEENESSGQEDLQHPENSENDNDGIESID